MGLLAKLLLKKQPQNLISFELRNSFSNLAGNNSAYLSAAYRAGVDCIARHCAKLTARAGGGRLERLLRASPNDYVTAYDLLYKAATAYFTQNNSFILIRRGDGGAEAFYNLNPSSVEFAGGTDGALYAKMLFPDGRQVTLPYADIVHLRRHFSDNELLGADNSPLHPLIDTSETLTQATAKAAQNAVNIRGVLKFTSLVNPTQVKLEKEQFVKDYLSLSNTGGVAATDQRFDFVPTNAAAYSVPAEQIGAINAQIYSYLGINQKIVDGTFSEDEFQSFYESVIEPFALQMSLEFTKKCGIDIQFSSERLEFSSARTRISLLRNLLPYGIVSINEARRLLALPEVEDGDKRLQSLNFADTAIVNKYQLESEEDEDGTEKL
jgi:HK97 family phage portal protein